MAIGDNILDALIQTESGGNPRALGKAGEIGLAQIKPSTAAQFGVTADALWHPEVNRMVADRYLSSLVTRYKGNVPMALAAYNAGPGNVDKGHIPASTRSYVSKILGLAGGAVSGALGEGTAYAGETGVRPKGPQNWNLAAQVAQAAKTPPPDLGGGLQALKTDVAPVARGLRYGMSFLPPIALAHAVMARPRYETGPESPQLALARQSLRGPAPAFIGRAQEALSNLIARGTTAPATAREMVAKERTLPDYVAAMAPGVGARPSLGPTVPKFQMPTPSKAEAAWRPGTAYAGEGEVPIESFQGAGGMMPQIGAGLAGGLAAHHIGSQLGLPLPLQMALNYFGGTTVEKFYDRLMDSMENNLRDNLERMGVRQEEADTFTEGYMNVYRNPLSGFVFLQSPGRWVASARAMGMIASGELWVDAKDAIDEEAKKIVEEDAPKWRRALNTFSRRYASPEARAEWTRINKAAASTMMPEEFRIPETLELEQEQEGRYGTDPFTGGRYKTGPLGPFGGR